MSEKYLDNNKKGHPLKYQRYEKSNKYAKVTGSILIKYHYCCEYAERLTGRSQLTYENQVIPFPYLMPVYKNSTSFTNGKIIIDSSSML